MSTKKLTTEQFIAKAKEVHNNKYDYELVEYTNTRSKIKIVCRLHGVWEQIPNSHLNGRGCPHCGNEARAKNQTATAKSEFATKANLVHNSKYTYELVEYTNAHTKVSISCPQHGSFEQKPNSHLSGKGCPVCALAESGWTRTAFAEKCTKNNDSKGILYILECYNDTERFVKIGITSRSIKQRYDSKASMPYEYTTLHELEADPEVIYDLETLLHRKSCNYKYTPITQFAGSSTECFEADTTYIDKLNTYINKLTDIHIRSHK